jgi:hypothetical protein
MALVSWLARCATPSPTSRWQIGQTAVQPCAGRRCHRRRSAPCTAPLGVGPAPAQARSPCSAALSSKQNDARVLLKLNLSALALRQNPQFPIRLRIQLDRLGDPHRPPPGRGRVCRLTQVLRFCAHYTRDSTVHRSQQQAESCCGCLSGPLRTGCPLLATTRFTCCSHCGRQSFGWRLSLPQATGAMQQRPCACMRRPKKLSWD